MANLSILRSIQTEWSTFKTNERYYLIGLLFVLLSELWFNQVSAGLTYLFFFSAFFIKGFSRKKLGSKSDYLLIFLVGFWVLNLIGLLWTTNLEEGVAKLDIKSSLLILPIVLAFPGRDDWKKWWPFIRDFFILSILLTFAICMVRASFLTIYHGSFYDISTTGGIGSNRFTYSSMVGFIMHPSYMSLFSSLAILTFWNRTKFWNYKNGLIMLSLILFVLLLSSRGGLLALIVATFFGLIFKAYKVKSRNSILFIILLPVIIFIGFQWLPNDISYRYQKVFSEENMSIKPHQKNYSSTQARIATWASAKKLITRNLILGVGPGDVKDELNTQYLMDGFDYGAQESFNTHNSFLQTQLGIGLMGSLYWIVFFVWAFIKGFKTANFTALTFTILLAVGMLTESLLERNWGVFFFVFFSWMAFIASSVDEYNGHKKTEEQSTRLA